MGMGRESLLQQCATMPGGIIDRDHDLGVLPGRIGASDILEVRRKCHLQTLLFALAGLHFAARGLLEQAGRQLAGHDMQRVAKTYFNENNRLVLYILPKTSGTR